MKMKFNKRLLLSIAAFGSLLAPLSPVLALTWTPSPNVPNKTWWSVASSGDGTNLVVAAYGGGIYTSTNSGLTWISNNVPARNWYSVASSADAKTLVAVINVLSTSGAGGIYISTNGGGTWTSTSAPSSLHSWASVSCSANGNKIVASGAQALTRQIHTSPDFGNTWNLTSAPNLSWYSVASSADGTKLVALAWQNNVIYTSTDSGITWTPNTVPSNYWYSVASSANGIKLAAVVDGGGIFTSTNSGAAWTSNNVPSQNWKSVASSSDGSKLVAAAPGVIYTSADSGQNWTSNNVPAYYWTSVASSADGNRLVAVAATGQIYTAQLSPPLLNMILSGTNLTLSWPAAMTGFQLYQNSNLTTINWTSVTNSVSVTDGQNQVTVSKTNRQTFYRLKGQ